MSRRKSLKKSSGRETTYSIPAPPRGTGSETRDGTREIKSPPIQPSETDTSPFELPGDFVTREGLELFAKRTPEEKAEFFLLFSRLLRDALDRARGLPN
jgi:hypothetical protein